MIHSETVSTLRGSGERHKALDASLRLKEYINTQIRRSPALFVTILAHALVGLFLMNVTFSKAAPLEPAVVVQGDLIKPIEEKAVIEREKVVERDIEVEDVVVDVTEDVEEVVDDQIEVDPVDVDTFTDPTDELMNDNLQDAVAFNVGQGDDTPLGLPSSAGVTGRDISGPPKSMGYEKGMAGDLIGTVYDLKRDGRGKERSWNYMQDVKKIVTSAVSLDRTKDFFRIDKKLYLSHLFIPVTDAAEGPRQFGVENEMQPKGFVVHYRGNIEAPSSGTFRFAGHGDDLLMVLVDGKVVLEANWGGYASDWRPSDSERRGKDMCFTGQHLVYGDWIKLKKGDKPRIDILFGEHPGGKVSACLLIQDKDTRYPTTATGRPILPPFAVQNLTAPERKRLFDFEEWEFNKRIPSFGVKKKRR